MARFAAWVALALLAGAGAGVPGLALAQTAARRTGPDQPVSSRSFNVSRAELTQAMADADRRGDRREADAIRTRLARGDFRPGDRLGVQLVADSARQFELVVRDSVRVDALPYGSFSLAGVLRSEAQPVVLRFYQRFFREPEVRVQPLLRLGVKGAVGKPGFYSVPPDVPLVDLVNSQAGGAGGNANVSRIEVQRGGRGVIDSKTYARAARDGLTPDELAVQSGDEVMVPEKKQRSTTQIVQNVFFAVSALTSLLFLIRAFYND